MKESYTQVSYYFPTIAFHIEITPLVDGTYELIQEPDGNFWSLGQRRRINWNLKLLFGSVKAYWLYRHYWRQAPVHNPIISKLCNLLLITYAFKLLELNENLRCIILGSYWLNTRIWVRIDAMLIGLVKVGWLHVTRELTGVDCLLSAITIRIMDGLGYKFYGWNPSVLIKLLRPQCVVIMVKRLKVLARCRELWVSGKPSNFSARQMDIPPHSLVEIGS